MNKIFSMKDKIISWKDKPIIQNTTTVQKNKNNLPTGKTATPLNLLKPQPLRIYRREISNINKNNTSTICSRTASKINDFERPNGYYVFSNPNQLIDNDIKNTFNLIAVKDNSNCCPLSTYSTGHNTVRSCISNQSTALKRCRSAGMTPKRFNPLKNNDQYYSCTRQYLNSRNMSIEQNEYNYLRYGDISIKPGSAFSQQNVYSAKGISHCNSYYISAAIGNNTLTCGVSSSDGSQITQIQVIFQDGYYDATSLQGIINNTLLANSKPILFNINYNTKTSLMEIDILSTKSVYPSSPGYLGYIYIPQSFSNVIGFPSGYYSDKYYTTAPSPVLSITPVVYYSTISFGVKPQYVTVAYKPSNSQFAQQGGVSSSALISRKKYNTITTIGGSYYTPYGSQVANALAYGGTTPGYTIKDKKGFPNTNFPVVSKYTNKISFKSNRCYRYKR